MPTAVLDVTDEVSAARVEVGLRSRTSRVTWMAPTRDELTITDDDSGAVAFGATAAASVDPDSVAFGRALDPDLWELNVRCTLAGSPTQRPLRSSLPPSGVLLGSGLRLVYTNADGALTLALGRTDEAVRRLMPAAVAAVSLRDGATVLTVPLEGVAPVGAEVGEHPTHVAIAPPSRGWSLTRRRGGSPFRDVDATLRANGGRVVLDVALPAGWTSGRVRIGAEHPDGRAWWTVGVDGRLTAGPQRRRGPSIRARAASRARSAIRRFRSRLR